MSQNIYCKPRLYLEDVGIIENFSGGVDFPGSNQLCQLKAKIPGFHLAESSLLNKEVRFYLNYGGEDTVPYFIGYIQAVKPTDVETSITAFDSRCFIMGRYATKIDLTDEDNYDGYTLGQFIFKHIQDNINTPERDYIDLSVMNDTDPPVPMNGVRGINEAPYEILLSGMRMAIDDSDPFDIFDYEMGANFTNLGMALYFIKQKKLDDVSMTLSFGDGMKKYKYTRKVLPNRAQTDDVTVDFGSTLTPRVSRDVSTMIDKNIVKKDYPTRALIQNEAIKHLVRARLERYDITIDATKGHYLQLGSVVHLDTEEEIRGNHRLVSKKITFGNTMTLSLQLNSRPITIDNYQ